ncbi:hypothetical protein DdX_19625 [Ditylenchus destructor]|uniref:DUF4097 domain-containing protein n=1 Tax=Ditylenchus destructor TaxID=166010 RepID=A0AAD4MI35_9BILA|nr:hypothetical protein DdX_19625 [Ditylenchus destructor]
MKLQHTILVTLCVSLNVYIGNAAKTIGSNDVANNTAPQQNPVGNTQKSEPTEAESTNEENDPYHTGTPFSVHKFPINDIEKVKSKTDSGEIYVIGNSTANEVKVKLYITGNNGIAVSKLEIERRLKAYYNLDIDVNGKVIKAHAKETDLHVPDNQRLRIAFVIYTPEKISINLCSDQGDVIIKQINGTIVAKTVQGNVNAENCKGTTQNSRTAVAIGLYTDQGNIVIKNLEGNVKALTDAGDIWGNTLKGYLFAKTDAGNVTLTGIAGSVSAISDAGTVSVRMTEVTGKVSASSDSDDVTLELPKNGKYALDLKCSESLSAIGLTNNFVAQISKRKWVQGKYNGGGFSVKVRAEENIWFSLV